MAHGEGGNFAPESIHYFSAALRLAANRPFVDILAQQSEDTGQNGHAQQSRQAHRAHRAESNGLQECLWEDQQARERDGHHCGGEHHSFARGRRSVAHRCRHVVALGQLFTESGNHE